MCSVDLLCSSDGPSTPFTGWFLLWDTTRVVCIVIALVLVIHTPKLLAGSGNTRQGRRYTALALLMLVAAGTEAEHLGDLPSYRLALNLAAVLFAVSGIWGAEQRPVRRRDRAGQTGGDG